VEVVELMGGERRVLGEAYNAEAGDGFDGQTQDRDEDQRMSSFFSGSILLYS
jgi:hypothetical protein